ncbi:MAG: hypothetical protein AAB516_02055 [Patescibacteria group bacterium]
MTCINCGRKYKEGSKNHIKVLKHNNRCIKCGGSPNIFLNKKLLSKEYSAKEIEELEQKFGITDVAR